MNGLLLVDKPAGVTSHDVVDYLRKASGLRRIGHTGTLDPNATGLLVLCLGKATRLSEHLTGLDKTYEGTMRLGVTTTSHDIEGEVLEERPVPDITLEEIQQACNNYLGDIEQVPPMVSAVKVGGERLYKLARRGEEVERPPRQVHVAAFEALRYTPPDAELRVQCSSGTYVRSLCHDVGQDLGCGAALAALRRTYVGRFSVADARPMATFETQADVEAALLPLDEALDLPVACVRNSSRKLVAAGNSLVRSDLAEDCPINEGWVQLKSSSGVLLALGTVSATAAGVRIQPRRVFTK